jgi:hypothetical protein
MMCSGSVGSNMEWCRARYLMQHEGTFQAVLFVINSNLFLCNVSPFFTPPVDYRILKVVLPVNTVLTSSLGVNNSSVGLLPLTYVS